MTKILSARNCIELISKKKKHGEEKYRNIQIKSRHFSFSKNWKAEEGKGKKDMSKKNSTMAQYWNLNFKIRPKIYSSLLKRKEKLITELKVYSSNATKEILSSLKNEFKHHNSKSNNKKLSERNELKSLSKDDKFQLDLFQVKNIQIC